MINKIKAIILRALGYEIGSKLYEVSPYGTHASFLSTCLEFVRNTSVDNYFLIEIGTGGESSRILRNHIRNNPKANLISMESDQEWIAKYQIEYLDHERHEIIEVSKNSSWLSELEKLVTRIGRDKIELAFIDSAPWESRTISALILRDVSKLLLIHDVDYFPGNRTWGKELEPIQFKRESKKKYGFLTKEKIGKRNYDDMFKSWVECFPVIPGYFTGPPTLIGSNFIEVKDIKFSTDSIILGNE